MRQIEFEWPELGVVATATLADDKNPSKCNVLWDSLPVHTVQSHALASGDRMYAPWRVVSDVPSEWTDPRSCHPKIGFWEEKYWGNIPVKRGLVLAKFDPYFGWIDIIYGQLREAIPIAPIAYIVDEDLEKIARVGDAVWEGLMRQKGYKLTVRRKQP